MTLNVTVVVLFAISYVIRASGTYGKPASVGLIILSVVALLILVVSGWLGGMMAYHYGVRVADDETQREGFSQGTVTRSATRQDATTARRR
jgi:uncharacterized membrane protein